MALVLGSMLALDMAKMINRCATGMLSRKGRCATFSDTADGYLRGEGCGAVVLQPLSDAVEAGTAVWGMGNLRVNF